MTDKPSKADKIREIVQKAREALKARGGIRLGDAPANENERPSNTPGKPND